MKESTKIKARKIVENNLEYLDEVIEAALVNLLADEGVESDNEFITELQLIYERYVGEEKYGKPKV
ncbi:MAG: hypothetical protein ACR2LT_03500 [Pyrinomonadaceae bacterium]